MSLGFDPAFYLTKNPDVAKAGIDPLLHFQTVGFKEGRDPNALFDTDFYLSKNPDIAKAGINPLEHFSSVGFKEGRDPNANFDTDFYLSKNPDVAKAGVNPLEHFAQVGFKEGRDPNPFFDTDFYLSKNPDVAKAGANPLEHFTQVGFKEGRDPNAFFDTEFYLSKNPDVAKAGVNPLEHFSQIGFKEGRDPNAFFDTDFYLKQNPDVAQAGVNPLEHFSQVGFKGARNPSPFFDTSIYLKTNGDVADAGINPLEHFLTAGIKEFRAPAPGIDFKIMADDPVFKQAFETGDFFKLAERATDIAPFLPTFKAPEGFDIVNDVKSFPTGFVPADPNFKLVVPEGFVPPPGAVIDKFFDLPNTFTLPAGVKLDATAEIPPNFFFAGGELPPGFVAPPGFKLADGFVPPPDFTEFKDIVLPPGFQPPPGFDPNLLPPGFDPNLPPIPGGGGGGPSPNNFAIKFGSGPVKATVAVDLKSDTFADDLTEFKFAVAGGTVTAVPLTTETTMAGIKAAIDGATGIGATLAGSVLTITSDVAGSGGALSALELTSSPASAVASTFKIDFQSDAIADQITKVAFKVNGVLKEIDTSAATDLASLKTAIHNSTDVDAAAAGGVFTITSATAGVAGTITDVAVTQSTPAVPWVTRWVLTNDMLADQITKFEYTVGAGTPTFLDTSAATDKASLVTLINNTPEFSAQLVNTNELEIKAETPGAATHLSAFKLTQSVPAVAPVFTLDLTDTATADTLFLFQGKVNGVTKEVWLQPAVDMTKIKDMIDASPDYKATLTGSVLSVSTEATGAATTLTDIAFTKGGSSIVSISMTDAQADSSAAAVSVKFEYKLAGGPLQEVDVKAATTVAEIAATLDALPDLRAFAVANTTLIVAAEDPSVGTKELSDIAFKADGVAVGGVTVGGITAATGSNPFGALPSIVTPGANSSEVGLTAVPASTAAGLDAVIGPYTKAPTELMPGIDAGTPTLVPLGPLIQGVDIVGPFPAHSNFASPADTMFEFGLDKMQIQNNVGTPQAVPTALFAVSVASAATPADVPTEIVTAAGGNWGANKAFLAKVDAGGGAGVYLFVNDGTANAEAGMDVFVRMTIIGGVPVTPGALTVTDYFI
ncbi:MAG: hypothetical protein SF002_14535 [Alphaproteobacteria bacterium]|nr:hypothetical protein [Alphaproteobacteria bacterium]